MSDLIPCTCTCMYIALMSKWVSDCCLAPNEQFYSYIMARTSYIQWNDGDVGFVLDQHS